MVPDISYADYSYQRLFGRCDGLRDVRVGAILDVKFFRRWGIREVVRHGTPDVEGIFAVGVVLGPVGEVVRGLNL